MAEPYMPKSARRVENTPAGSAYRPASAKKVEPGIVDTLRGGLANLLGGVSRNFADELAGKRAQADAGTRRLGGRPPEEMEAIYRLAAEKAKAGIPFSEAAQQAAAEVEAGVYTQGRDAFRRQQEAFRAENPGTALALNVAGGVLGGPPVGMQGGAAAQAAPYVAEGMLAGAGSADEMSQVPRDALAGGVLGFGSKVAGDLLGDFASRLPERVKGIATRRLGAAQTKAQEMGAEKVAEQVASAKGKLGAVTQEANRALENLLRLEATGGLSADQRAALMLLRQRGVLPALEQKLGDAMLEQVPGAAGRVDISRAALEGLTGRQSEATQEAAQAILSGGEAKKQIMERVNRYAPTVMGSLMGAGAGGATSLALGGGVGEALVGALAGAGIRPALRAGQRMWAHPAVQTAAFTPVQRGSSALSEALLRYSEPLASSVGRAGYDTVTLQDEEKYISPLAEALRKRTKKERKD
jgi:hypothetical protein